MPKLSWYELVELAGGAELLGRIAGKLKRFDAGDFAKVADIVTEIGDPGSDEKIPSEQAVAEVRTALQEAIDAINDTTIKASYFATVGAGTTSGQIAKPAGGQAAFVMDEWGESTDAILSTIEGGRPTFESPVDAAGNVVGTSFDTEGNFAFDGTPDPADDVALIYVYTAKLSDFISSEVLFESEIIVFDQNGAAVRAVDMNGKRLTNPADPTDEHGIGDRGYNDLRYLLNTLFDANTVLAADTDNAPAVLGVAESTVVGRSAGGTIAALNASAIRTIIDFYTQARVAINSIFGSDGKADKDIDLDGHDLQNAGAIDADSVVIAQNPTSGSEVGNRDYNDDRYLPRINDIGIAGTAGFGAGVCPQDLLPDEFTPMDGYYARLHDNYGNYQYQDGSICVWAPLFYYRIGHADNESYADYGVNSISIRSMHDYEDEAAANADGYALHRAFIDGGEVQSGFMFDKYLCSKAAWGAGYIASSIKDGLPISTGSAHNPISDLTACAGDYHYEAINAAHARDGTDGAINASSIWHVHTRFQLAALAMLSIAHAQAAAAATHCAWYDAAGITNYPKGCNDNALGDTDDGTVSYVSDEYSNCGKTGSGTPFAKTTHNGQACGVCDLSGPMWRISLGLTRPGASAGDTAQQNDASAFYVLKESVAAKLLQSGWHSGAAGAAYEAWGDAAHLAEYYDAITLSHIGNGTGWEKFGNGANQVLAADLTGDNWLKTALGLPKDQDAQSASGTNLFGTDGLYEYHRANLCVLSCGYWNGAGPAGPSAAYLGNSRVASGNGVGFALACYLG